MAAACMPSAPVRTGWGGRMSDTLVAANAGALIPTAVSVSGSQLFTLGASTAPLVVPQNGGVTVSGPGARMRCRWRATTRCVSLLKAAKAPATRSWCGARQRDGQGADRQHHGQSDPDRDAAAGDPDRVHASTARCSTPASRSSCGRSRG